MKVILTKDSKYGKENAIIEVADGYAKNFLIPKGFAMAYSQNNLKIREQKLSDLSALEHEKRSKARELQKQIEELSLMFTLDAAIDKAQNLHVHGSVSTKELKTKLLEHKIKLHDHAIQHVHLNVEGTHVVEVSLYKDIKAKLRVNLHINVKK